VADSKHEAVWDWLLTCPTIKDLFFNFSQSANGDTVLAPLTSYSDTPVREFTSGASERWYDFAIVRFDALSIEPNDEQNIEVLVDVEGIAAWIESQAASGHFPTFPTKHTIQSVAALPSNIGYVAARDETGAKYQIQFRIEYIKEV
jgi:hypothetical protein